MRFVFSPTAAAAPEATAAPASRVALVNLRRFNLGDEAFIDLRAVLYSCAARSADQYGAFGIKAVFHDNIRFGFSVNTGFGVPASADQGRGQGRSAGFQPAV